MPRIGQIGGTAGLTLDIARYTSRLTTRQGRTGQPFGAFSWHRLHNYILNSLVCSLPGWHPLTQGHRMQSWLMARRIDMDRSTPTVGSIKLEHGCSMIFTGLPSLLGLRLMDGSRSCCEGLYFDSCLVCAKKAWTSVCTLQASTQQWKRVSHSFPTLLTFSFKHRNLMMMLMCAEAHHQAPVSGGAIQT